MSRVNTLRNIYTEFGATWKIFRHRKDDIYSITYQKLANPIEAKKVK